MTKVNKDGEIIADNKLFTELPDGRVILDATSIEVPSRLTLPQNRSAMLQQFVRDELSRRAAEEGHESFEEADDFSFDEDEPMTPYELAMLDSLVFQYGVEKGFFKPRDTSGAKRRASDREELPAGSEKGPGKDVPSPVVKPDATPSE